MSEEIPIINKTTGEVTTGKSMKAQMPVKPSLPDRSIVSESESRVSLVDDEHNKSKTIPEDNKDEVNRTENDEQKQKVKKSKKSLRPEIQSLAQYIEFAYSRKGQRISLPSKLEKAICNDYVIEPEMREKLLKLADDDILLAVPRQLLLISRNIVGYPRVRSELKSFIEQVLKNHFIFLQNDLAATLNNLPDSLSPQEALNKVGKANLPKLNGPNGQNHFKSTDQDVLRSNAAYCLAIWFVESRGYPIEQIIQMLYTALWKPNTAESANDTLKLRAITEIQDLDGVGLACSIFKKETDKQAAAAAAALRSQEALSEKIRILESDINRIQQEQQQSTAKIGELEKQLVSEREAHAHTRVHLGDDKEQLRSRLLRRLKTEANLLQEGLHALRRDPPKIHVMDDHAERALDGLYKEIRELESED